MNRLLCATAAAAIAVAAYPCGPYFFTKNDLSFFRVTERNTSSASNDKTREENLRMWQQQTSTGIPLADIEEVVYGNFTAQSWDEGDVPETIKDNKFYKWIRRNNAVEVQEFLSFAKLVERRRFEAWTAWYYPAHKVNGMAGTDAGFSSLIEACSSHRQSKLRERYGLQMMRLIYSSGLYNECEAEFDRWFGNVPDDNLMKRMAMEYVADAWRDLGDTAKANRYYALAGIKGLLTGVDCLSYMAEVSPSTYPMEEFESLFGHYHNFHYKFNPYKKVEDAYDAARKVVSDGKADNLGEWEFLLAYLEGEYYNNYEEANKHIISALSHGLRTSTGADHARAYKMALDGQRGNVKPLLDDLQWIEHKVADGERDIQHWRNLMLGIVYGYWFPTLRENQQLPMAILLSNYVENFCGCLKEDIISVGGNRYSRTRLLTQQEKKQMRASRDKWNEVDFGGRLVDFMMSLKPQDIIDYKNCLNDSSKLVTYLRDNSRNDDDFLNEIIGTLCLHQCNYQMAVHWLSMVSPGYQYTLNTYKGGYLTRDPFAFTSQSRANTTESKKAFPELRDKNDIKLTFAKKMCRLEQEMKHGKNGDEQAVATVEYALARHESFSSCWALTSYKKGYTYGSHDVYPLKPNWRDVYESESLYNIEPFYTQYFTDNPVKLDEPTQRMIDQAVASIQGEEAAAQAQYLLGNLKTIAKKYPSTATGRFLSSHCDNWKDWL